MARGDEPAETVLQGGQVLSVFTGEVFRADVAIAGDTIIGIGSYDGVNAIDVRDRILVPGFIDGHCHIESSKLDVAEFARVILSRGTTSVVVDPHELANVLGLAGIEYVLTAGEGLPVEVFVTLPSCVPASEFESPRGPLEACDLMEMLARPRVLGIAEMMNYPAAIAGAPEVLAKMAATAYRHVDGHAPGVRGRALNAYIVSGPSSDHECSDLEEALEKKRLGMWIMIREATMIRNLVDLLPLVTRYGTDNCMFVTDDREASTLLAEGHINSMVRTAVEHGLPVGDAVKLASLNVARYHGLDRLGAVAPGYQADIQVLPDLRSFEPEAVYKRGVLVAQEGKTFPFSAPVPPAGVTGTVNAREVSSHDFRIPVEGGGLVRVIDLVADQVLTREVHVPLVPRGGVLEAAPAEGIAKVAVVERHLATGRIGKGFVRGFGLREGAFASTVAHDAHNIIVCGVDDRDMAASVARLAELGGGLVVACGGVIAGEMPLPIAGLMSSDPAEQVVASIRRLEDTLAGMGVNLDTPFMYLSFLGLSVIPELRVTDRGLVDVHAFEIVPLGVA
jgi:adenine deaminase